MATPARTRPPRLAGVAVSLALVAAGCGSGSGAPAAQPTTAGPSNPSVMVCSTEARDDITAALGVTLTGAQTGSWAAPVYTCRYPLSVGVMVLSVRELATDAAATAYFTSVRDAATHPVGLPGLGEAAFSEDDGTAYTQKDAKVLEVDVTALPDFLGTPRLSRAAAGVRVAQVIMGCWTGE
jgi:hypothetical protein